MTQFCGVYWTGADDLVRFWVVIRPKLGVYVTDVTSWLVPGLSSSCSILLIENVGTGLFSRADSIPHFTQEMLTFDSSLRRQTVYKFSAQLPRC